MAKGENKYCGKGGDGGGGREEKGKGRGKGEGGKRGEGRRRGKKGKREGEGGRRGKRQMQERGERKKKTRTSIGLLALEAVQWRRDCRSSHTPAGDSRGWKSRTDCRSLEYPYSSSLRCSEKLMAILTNISMDSISPSIFHLCETRLHEPAAS